MTPEQINELLLAGIKAAKAGDKRPARDNLLAVIEADERNEKAWLWLSSIVESEEEKKICLENVLEINPANKAARRGLKKIDELRADTNTEADEVVIRQDVGHISPASAMLYPERSIKQWSYRETPLTQKSYDYSYQTESRYDDVWETEDDICPYCAKELALDDWRCPRCKRSLKFSYYRYPKPSSDLWIYLVLILGIGQFSTILILLDLIFSRSVLDLVWQSLIFIAVIVLATGIFLRRFWAYLGSIVVLIMVMLSLLISILVEPTSPSVINDLIATEGFFQGLAEIPLLFAIEPFVGYIVPIQLVAVILAMLYGIFRVGPDFERISARKIATIDKGLSGASMYYARGKHYAESKMWANTVLHYRRSAALEPTRSFYLEALGLAYSELGYYQRSLDVLESALKNETDNRKADALQESIHRVQELAAHASSESTRDI